MASVRVATFNVENLFARWRFDKAVDPATAHEKGWTVEDTLFHEFSVADKAITGEVLKEVDADVLCLQEVENVDTLKRFRTRYLGGRSGYPYVAGIDGNDQRLIDVAVLSRLPIVHVRSYQHLPDPVTKRELFSRDCLEVDIDAGDGRLLTVFVNHFKSMMGGRATTRPKRERQAQAVKDIVAARFGPDPGDHPFVVVGDLNDYPETDDQGTPGIADLTGWGEVENVLERLPQDERWTHYYKSRRDYKQLDYLLPSRSLATASAALPVVMRKGLPRRADRYSGERFDAVGDNEPKASDHCPVVIDLTLN